jgi:transcriptional regulator with XRE-family HTH domain
MNKSNHFAERLRALREAAGLSQYEVAKRAGLTRQTLSRLEMGDREPGWQTVQLLAHVLGATCTDFLDPAVKPPADVPGPRPRGRPRKPDATDQKKGEQTKGRKRKGGKQQ